MSTQVERQRARSITVEFASRGLPVWVPVLAALGLVLALSCGVLARDNAKSKEAELREMRQRIESVRQSIQADAERRETLVGELKKADESIQTTRGQLADIRARRLAAEQDFKQLQDEHAAAQTKLVLERTALAQELKLTYMNGRNEPLKLLLNQQDPAQLGRMLSYYGYFGRARAEHIKAINEQLAHLELLAEKIQGQAANLRDLEDERARGAAALTQARQRRADTLAQVENKLKTGTQRLSKLQSDARALERLVDELRKAMQRAAELARANAAKGKAGAPLPPPAGRGSWPWPVQGELLARFGQLRAGGPMKWSGLMIASTQGAPVRAPAAGQVLYADWLPGLGLLMVLDHGGGIMSLYGHNEQLYKKVGEHVAAGEVLSAVGETGIDGRSGLYLEIRNGKQPVDPLNWLGRP